MRPMSDSAQKLRAMAGTSSTVCSVTPCGNVAALSTGHTAFISIRRERSGLPMG